MIRWFGAAPFAAMCCDVPHVPTPVGATCIHCEEPITAEDNGYFYSGTPARPAHYECFMRQIVGSVAHQQHRCSCFGGTDAEDFPQLSRRDAARLAVLFWEGRQ